MAGSPPKKGLFLASQDGKRVGLAGAAREEGKQPGEAFDRGGLRDPAPRSRTSCSCQAGEAGLPSPQRQGACTLQSPQEWVDPGAPQVVLVVKKLPVQDPRETWAQSRAREDPLEEGTCLKKPVDRGARRATVLGVAKSQTLLSN